MDIQRNQKTNNKMAVVSPHISIITLYVNAVNSTTQRHRVEGWIKEHDPTLRACRRLISALKCIKQLLIDLEGETNKNTVGAQREEMKDNTSSKWQPQKKAV